MRALIQRVLRASVTVDGFVTGSIGPGLVVLLGIGRADSHEDATYLAEKTANLRIFSDSENRFNLSALEIGGELLLISQFTLYADTRKGRRPSFVDAAPPEEARQLFEQAVVIFREQGLKVETGQFQQYMRVELLNDGPVTLLLDSADRHRGRRG
ncbi:MAG: D-aminoacyl-tRNA deacylase [Dehalococcoidia bacterium]|nr:D-aminoacyl-tRNA deacylase [Dehalococcoidia bacterium]